MSEAAERATIGAVIRLLCDRFPRAFSGRGQPRRPLKVGIHADLVATLDGAVRTRELRTALRAYTRQTQLPPRFVGRGGPCSPRWEPRRHGHLGWRGCGEGEACRAY